MKLSREAWRQLAWEVMTSKDSFGVYALQLENPPDSASDEQLKSESAKYLEEMDGSAHELVVMGWSEEKAVRFVSDLVSNARQDYT